MNHSIALLSLIFCLVCNVVSSYSQSLLSFSKNDYKAASQNWSVECDTTGYTYFANSSGLLQFDGISWQLYPSSNSSITRTVAVDHKRVYTGSYREIGYWDRNPTGDLDYFSLTDSVQSQFETNEEFWNILTTGQQTVFQSFAGLYIYENKRFKIIKPGGFINFTTQIKNTIYVAIHQKGIYRLDNKELVPFIENSFLKDQYVRFIATGKEAGTMYIGTESNGLYVYDTISQKFKVLTPGLQSFFKKNKINHGRVTSSGNIVIGTILDGIISFTPDGKINYHYNNKNGLLSNTVLGISSDRFNNTWLALDTGIELITPARKKAYQTYKEKDLGAVYTGALFNERLYLGTNQGLYYKNSKDQEGQFQLMDHTQGQVWDCRMVDKHLFVGHNSGTYIDDGRTFKNLSSYSGAYNIKQHPHHPDILIQGTYNQLVVYKRNDEDWSVANTIEGFNNLIRFIEVDHLGNLWATHYYGGLYKIRLNDKLDTVESVRKYENFGSDSINKGLIRAFKIENQIVITSGHELYTYDDLNDSIVPYIHLNELLGEYRKARRVVATSNHNYWFITDKGMAFFRIYADEVKKIKDYPIEIFENNLIPDHENIVQLNDSTAMVCMENGYTILNLNNKPAGNEIEAHHLTLRKGSAFNSNGDHIPMDVNSKIVSLEHSQNNLSLQYSFPILNGEAIKFQYQIEGLADKWSSKMDQPRIELSRIPAGEYTISIKAVNNWLQSSKINQIKLIVHPPWYITTWAMLIYGLLMIILILGFRHITSRKIKLKEKRKREEKEKELVQLKNEKLSSELSLKSQKLASSAMSIIKKNEFLLSLKAKINKQKEILGTRYPDKYYQDLIDKIDGNITGQDDWQLFEANFEQAHETFLRTMKNQFPDLTPSDLRLCAYLRINLTSKEIAPLLGISVRGVENHRYRLRKKLGLTGDDNLIDFIINAN